MESGGDSALPDGESPTYAVLRGGGLNPKEKPR